MLRQLTGWLRPHIALEMALNPSDEILQFFKCNSVILAIAVARICAPASPMLLLLTTKVFSFLDWYLEINNNYNSIILTMVASDYTRWVFSLYFKGKNYSCATESLTIETIADIFIWNTFILKTIRFKKFFWTSGSQTVVVVRGGLQGGMRIGLSSV